MAPWSLRTTSTFSSDIAHAVSRGGVLLSMQGSGFFEQLAALAESARLEQTRERCAVDWGEGDPQARLFRPQDRQRPPPRGEHLDLLVADSQTPRVRELDRDPEPATLQRLHTLDLDPRRWLDVRVEQADERARVDVRSGPGVPIGQRRLEPEQQARVDRIAA